MRDECVDNPTNGIRHNIVRHSPELPRLRYPANHIVLAANYLSGPEKLHTNKCVASPLLFTLLHTRCLGLDPRDASLKIDIEMCLSCRDDGRAPAHHVGRRCSTEKKMNGVWMDCDVSKCTALPIFDSNGKRNFPCYVLGPAI